MPAAILVSSFRLSLLDQAISGGFALRVHHQYFRFWTRQRTGPMFAPRDRVTLLLIFPGIGMTASQWREGEDSMVWHSARIAS
jgi:hypothetical protein